MKNDIAISYNGKLIEINDNIKQLETLGINADNYNLLIDNIKTDVEAQIKECNTKYNQIDSNIFLNESLVTIYTNAINKIDKVNQHILSIYNDYYKIRMKYTELNNIIQDIDNINIQEFSKKILDLLKELKTLESIDYEDERDLIEGIYNLVYMVIKLEIVYTSNSQLLEYVKTNDNDISYITKLIKDDIEKLSRKNSVLSNKVQELDKIGLRDNQYLDKDLIMLICVTDNKKLSTKVEKEFLNSIDQYTKVSNELVKLEEINKSDNNRIAELKKENKNLEFKKLLKRISLLVNLGIVSGAIAFSIQGTKKMTQSIEYKTITTTYDTSMPEEEILEEYLPETMNQVSLTEYSEWEEPGYFRDGYKRYVYNYDLSNVEFYDNVEDYLNPELKEKMVVTQYVEESDEIPVEQYTGNKYVINHVYQDKDDYRLVDNPQNAALLSLIFSGIIIGIDIFLLNVFSKNKLKDLKRYKKANKKELVEKRQLLIETKTRINELNEQLFTQRKDIENKYESLPVFLQEDEKIKEKVLSLDNNYKK